MPRLLVLNNAVLFLCCAIYLGTGVSLVFFQFPLEPKLTVDNYRLIFVEPVTNATRFFTYMTIVMLFAAAIMLVTEWFSGLRWVPTIVLLAVVASTLLTLIWILPLNDRLAKGIADANELKTTFSSWASLNRVRVSLWAVQWTAMMYYFYNLAVAARADR
jgi:MFS superfamily sulfate permease-like transporter